MSEKPIFCGACGAKNPAAAITCVACGALLAAYQTPEGADEEDLAPAPPLPSAPELPQAPPPTASVPELEAVAPSVPGDLGSTQTDGGLTPVVPATADEEPVATAAESLSVDVTESDLQTWLEEQREMSRVEEASPPVTPPPAEPMRPSRPTSYNRPAPRRPAWAPSADPPGTNRAEWRRQLGTPPLERLGNTPPERLIVAGVALVIGSCVMVSVTRSTAGAGCFVGLGLLAGIIGFALLGTGINAITKGRSS